ncbi:MAG: MiaB/RimO family radical SAM methylthiotransferase [Spirochaetaceae bacterium]|jgi:threonylcarbamoyladenosine tRNA methylthiotransferase MtaB|nr:MiaB/RimO family radical SAM methylthiotransferase [Spirochaetaceae bacterium]
MGSPISIGVYTVGCKLNQLESEAVAQSFRGAGFRVFPWNPGAPPAEGAPDVLVVNTCTVTSKAEQKARRVIRKALRDHPKSALVVTGCYAQLDPKAIESLGMGMGIEGETRVFVLAGSRKNALLELPALLAEAGRDGISRVLGQWLGTSMPDDERFGLQPTDFAFHSRAFLKIQDGCDNRCAYCRVPLARGPSASLTAARALAALTELEARGYREAVLAGVNISQYRDGALDLAGLAARLLQGTSAIGLRFSSLEPDGVTPALLDTLSHPRVRPHFHLSAQSGSPLVLARMGRRYTPEVLGEVAGSLRSVKDDPFLSCDIIAGFPGETPEAFEETLALCLSLDFAHIHGFPYSRRPGTPAWACAAHEAVPEREARARVERLLALGRQGKRRYIRRWIGKTVGGIVESLGEPAGFSLVVSDNYLKLRLDRPKGDIPPKGAAARCRITGFPEGENAPFDAAARWEP